MKTSMKRTLSRAGVVVAATTVLSACGGPDVSRAPVHTVAAEEASNPTVAIDPDRARTYVAWVDDAAGSASVWLRAVAPDGSMEAPVRVNHLEGDAAPHYQAPAKVAVGPEGNVYVAWTNATPIEGRPFPASDLRFARSTDGGRTFEPAHTVNDDPDGPPASHTFHDLAVLPDGGVVVSWLDSRREWAAEAGQAAHHGESTAGEAPGPDARIAISTDQGRSFGPSRIVDHQTCPCCKTAMAVGSDGTVHLAWRKIFEGDVRDIVVATSGDAGRSFGTPERVAPDDWVFPGCPHAGPSLMVDQQGALHAAWYTGRAGAAGIYHARSDDGGATFHPARALLTADHVPPSQTAMAIDDDGVAWVVWEDRTLARPSIRIVAVPSDGELAPGRARVVPGTYPSIAAAGELVALAWLEEGQVLLQMLEPSD